MRWLWIILTATCAFAQPDAPQPQPKRNGPWAPWDYSHPTLSVAQTFRSPHFLIPTLTADAAYVADAWQSRRAIERGCAEGNADLPARATAGDYAVNWAKVELPMDVLQWALVKLNRRVTNYFVIGVAGTRSIVHMHGMAVAMGCR